MESTLYAEIIAVVVVLFYVLAIASAVEAILKTRTAPGAVAWTLSLLAFPLLSVPLYLVFGRSKFAGYLDKRNEIEIAAKRLLQRTSGSVEQHIVELSVDTPLYSSLFNLARVPATRGNRVDLLIDGEQTFDSIAAGLAAAEHYILFQFYIIRDDQLGKRLGRILRDRARAGVQVYLLYDEIGSRRFERTHLCRQLLSAGVHVAPFNTTQGRRNRLQLNFRNHRKVVVVDGRNAWIGGHNIGDEYMGLSRRRGAWRDTHTRVQGPAVLGAELAFATDWLWATQSHLQIDWEFRRDTKGDSTVLVFPTDPASEYQEAGLMFHQAIVAARERIWIASPYFVPDQGIVAALQLAALRGVDVRVIIPDRPDGVVVGMANWSYTQKLLPVGVKVYRYERGFMHQKVFLKDDQVAGVGTANFDNRSFRLNFEITLLVQDADFAAEVENMLREDLRHCRQVSMREIEDKPFWFPLAMGVARLFAPVL
ncbi:MAG: cardiolipin synthase [Halioglobus sp.]|nr:cardiolipin synthase [Halioglobus sp.]